jgi:hypothetical protein
VPQTADEIQVGSSGATNKAYRIATSVAHFYFIYGKKDRNKIGRNGTKGSTS